MWKRPWFEFGYFTFMCFCSVLFLGCWFFLLMANKCRQLYNFKHIIKLIKLICTLSLITPILIFFKKGFFLLFAVNLPSDSFPSDWEAAWISFTHNVKGQLFACKVLLGEKRGVYKAPLSVSSPCHTPSGLLCSPPLQALLLEPHHSLTTYACSQDSPKSAIESSWNFP